MGRKAYHFETIEELQQYKKQLKKEWDVEIYISCSKK
jgi:hypothetical protein